MSILSGLITTKPLDVKIPKIFRDFFKPARYKIAYGGRGSSKSWTFAMMLILAAAVGPERILCTRELQTSIRDSVHKLLSDQIYALGLQHHFTILQNSITSKAGAEFIFKGLRHNAAEIKSMEGITKVWCEEAQAISKDSWDLLEPTIRKSGSEIWMTFNPDSINDATFDFVLNPRPDSIIRKVNYSDNPFFPQELRNLMEYAKKVDYQAYLHIWEGQPKSASDAQIFKDKFIVEAFESPINPDRFYYGADWGFSTDPSAVVRCFLKDNTLYIDEEAFGFGVETVDIPAFMRRVPGADSWPIRADSSRPEVISHCQRHGLPNVQPVKKWPGSIEDGVSWIRGLEKVVIHPRCKHIAEEFVYYSYKVDKQSGDILPEVVDKHNHGIDALRYACEPLISAKHTIRKAKISGF